MFRNASDMHHHDITQTELKLSVMLADHGLPDLLALLARAVWSSSDLGMRDVRRVLDTRADALNALAEVIR